MATHLRAVDDVMILWSVPITCRKLPPIVYPEAIMLALKLSQMWLFPLYNWLPLSYANKIVFLLVNCIIYEL
jgi:hypothetical protein